MERSFSPPRTPLATSEWGNGRQEELSETEKGGEESGREDKGGRKEYTRKVKTVVVYREWMRRTPFLFVHRERIIFLPLFSALGARKDKSRGKPRAKSRIRTREREH